MLAETPVTQHSPCYSVVSASLMNPLLDCSKYSPFCHTHYLIPADHQYTSVAGQTFYQAALLETNTSLLQRFTAESSQELISSEKYHSALRKLNNIAEACGDVSPPPLQIVISCLFLFSLYRYTLSAPFLNSLFSPFPHFPWTVLLRQILQVLFS